MMTECDVAEAARDERRMKMQELAADLREWTRLDAEARDMALHAWVDAVLAEPDDGMLDAFQEAFLEEADGLPSDDRLLALLRRPRQD